MNAGSNFIRNIQITNEKLQSSDTFLDFDIGAYLKDLCQKIIETYCSGDISFSADIQKQIIVSSERAISVGLIFSELTINSLKHALSRDELEIFIGVYTCDDQLFLSYSDSGAPFPADSLGLMVINGLVDRLDGRIEYDFSQIKQITIILPAPSASPALVREN